MNLWVGGVLATQQDMSALFWARGAERYLKPGGTIAFVLPFAAINRPAFTGLRRGDFGTVQTRVVEAWDLARVRPIFGGAIGTTSTCAMFGRREPAGMLPSEVEQFSGTLSRRDASEAEADASLRRVREIWPPVTTLGAGSPHYRARFKQGATIVPRRFFFVEREPAARLGDNPAAPRVHGRIGPLDRIPWREVEPPRGAVEAAVFAYGSTGRGCCPLSLVNNILGGHPRRWRVCYWIARPQQPQATAILLFGSGISTTNGGRIAQGERTARPDALSFNNWITCASCRYSCEQVA